MRKSARQWATLITVFLLLILLGCGFWWGWKELTKPIDTGIVPCITQEASVLTAGQVTVQVINVGDTNGLAGQVSDDLKAHGFQTKQPGDSKEQVSQTTVIGAKADSLEVQLVTGFFLDSQTRGDDRTDGTVTVLVTDAYGGFKPDAPTELDVPGGEICIQASTPAVEGSPS